MQALISVSDKTGVLDFARGLSALGVTFLSTGGTAKLLADAGLPVTEVAEHTGFPEMLDGRVKTLHPKIHGGLLARRDQPAHMAALQAHAITTIDLLIVNLYPFEATVARPGCTLDDAIENIDIGGPAMVRSAAKNWKDVAVLTDASQYAEVLAELQASGAVSTTTKFKLAVAAFNRISNYDAAISDYLSSLHSETDGSWARSEFPAQANGRFVKLQDLRYGENPHQSSRLLPRPAPGTRLAGHRAPVAGQGAVVQQHRRCRRRMGVRQVLHARRCARRVRDRQTRQPVRRGARRERRPGVSEGAPDRPDLGVRRHHRLQCRG